MTFIVLIGLLVFGAVLSNLRKRLTITEQRLDDLSEAVRRIGRGDIVDRVHSGSVSDVPQPSSPPSPWEPISAAAAATAAPSVYTPLPDTDFADERRSRKPAHIIRKKAEADDPLSADAQAPVVSDAPPSGVPLNQEPERVEDAADVLAAKSADELAEGSDPSGARTEDAQSAPVYSQPAPAPAPAPQKQPMGFEDLFGRKLPIWAGGATLAVAGVLLVKYSIDAGLISPAVRVLLGLLFGFGLIGGAEILLRQRGRVRDDRVHQALAGAGIASLYASILAAANLYQLIGGGTAFAGLVGVTGLAMGLSLRFGAPSAVLGLVGGLAAPALVSAQAPNVPLLCTYLALAMGGLTAISRRQRWLWLGIGALVGGMGWGLFLIIMGRLEGASSLSVGMMVLLAGLALPFFAFPDSASRALRLAGALAAALQIALLVATGGFGLLQWGLYGLLSVAIVWLAHREAMLRPATAVALATGLLLAAIWPGPPLNLFAMVLIGMAAVYAPPALLRLWKQEAPMPEAGQIAGLSLAGYAVGWWRFHEAGTSDSLLALAALVVSALPVYAVVSGWNSENRRKDASFALLVTAGAILIAVAGVLALPGWLCVPFVVVISVGLLMLSLRAEDARIEAPAHGFFAAAMVLLLTVDPHGLRQMERLFGSSYPEASLLAMLCWVALTLGAGMFAWHGRKAPVRMTFQVLATLFAYGALAQILPGAWLAVATAAGLALVPEISRRVGMNTPLPAILTGVVLALLWAMEPWAQWSGAASASLHGQILYVTSLPLAMEGLQRLLAPAALLLLALWRGDMLSTRNGQILAVPVALAALAGAHILYKQIFAIDSYDTFVRAGLAERTLWEALLLGAGYGLARMWRTAAPESASATLPGIVLIGAGMAHNVLYTLGLHNPLWSDQAVGALPLLNLLLPAFGMIALGMWLISQSARPAFAGFSHVREGSYMVAVILFAFASLRHMFAGSLLGSVPVGPAENILQSVLAIGLAIGFLLWGIWRSVHDWRIASLLVMLAAVGKVFLFDASGLTGLLRIASFLALGFSLIGIGWLYNRFLRVERQEG